MCIFDHLIHDQILMGYPEPNPSIVENLLLLRLLCRPDHAAVWSAPRSLESAVRNISSHVYNDKKRHVKFYVGELYRELLLPDLYRNIWLPDPVFRQLRHPVHISYSLDTMIDDYSATDSDINDSIDNWDNREDTKLTYKLTQRFTNISFVYLKLYPDLVRQMMVMYEGQTNVLNDYEAKEIRSICKLRIAV